MLPLSQNIDNSSAIFIINKLLKQNSQTFEKILSTFFVCNFFLTFDQSLATFFNNKVPKITNWQTFVKILQTFCHLRENWPKFDEIIDNKCQFHKCFMKFLPSFFSCVFVLLLPSVCIILNETKFLFMRSTLHFSVHLQYIYDILKLLFTLSFVNLPFSFFWKQCWKESNGWKNVLENESKIPAIFSIIHIELH